MTEREFLEAARSIALRHGAKRVVLFGSRARGTNTPSSDFDLAVYGAADVRAIAEDIDALPTLYSADVVDMDMLGNARLAREVEEHGVPV